MNSRGGLNQSLQLCTEFQALVQTGTFVTKPVQIRSGYLPKIQIWSIFLEKLVRIWSEIRSQSGILLTHHLPGEGYKDITQKSIDSYSPYWPAGQGWVCPWPFVKSYHLHTNVCQTILGDPVWLIYILNIWVWSTLLVYCNCVCCNLLY